MYRASGGMIEVNVDSEIHRRGLEDVGWLFEVFTAGAISLSLPLLGRPFGLSYSLTIVPSEHISKSPVGASDEIGREAR